MVLGGARPGAAQPLLHVAEWDVPARADPLLVKAHGLWAEHTCDAPMEQWTVTNETYATALDDPDEALGRAYGTPSAVAFDLEWYATAPTVALAAGRRLPSRTASCTGSSSWPADRCVLTEAPARRWHRWATALGVLALPEAYAHGSVRAPFAFPDGTVADWVRHPGRLAVASSAAVPAPAR